MALFYALVRDLTLTLTQTPNLGMALFYGLVPEALRAKSLQIMAQNAHDSSYLKAPETGVPGLAVEGGPGPHMTAGPIYGPVYGPFLIIIPWTSYDGRTLRY